MKGFFSELSSWAETPVWFLGFLSLHPFFLCWERAPWGKAQLRGSGREGVEHMMLLCQNRKRARFARIPNGIFQNLKSALCFCSP